MASGLGKLYNITKPKGTMVWYDPAPPGNGTVIAIVPRAKSVSTALKPNALVSGNALITAQLIKKYNAQMASE